ncbi:exodeoxyribonuclease V subunit beta [Capnocytophaga sp.]|uniref:UvrD-helicase domain-containing protein n=1 Tax=Capnocytophaga sp. TaxID=44737 RepID=UPI0026DBB55F|nr:UvrD-helicase domain-containing protein [Capnocytophaga sp.]MDO5105426.1 UvrD-helicase domain-containing protein [Capnocytophaga sp.]
MQPASYTIYNASAGSGKTYGLAKSYLRIVLSNKNPEVFRSLLAITFTNKAVFEMKNRIIEYLTLFSDDKMLSQPDPMFSELSKELKIAPTELKIRSEMVLKHILHNYAAFSISTIDGFNHQLIRNFAFDLRLNQFFEVQLDAKTLLQRAVDNLLNQAGEDAELTQLLNEFSKEKIKEDKSWDITGELLRVAQMLTVENHYWQLNNLKSKNLYDFQALKKNLLNKKNKALDSIQKNAADFLKLLDENALDKSAFKGGYAYDFFYKLNQNPENEPNWGSAWQENLPDKPLYASTAKNLNTALIDALQPQIVTYFNNIKSAFGLLNFVKNVLRNVVPLALLNRIQNEIELIKEDENILPIWEFNSIIFNEIATQPAPFIYERIGERYRHYFIDEFQDTSVLQWKNLIPLILNAVQSETLTKQRGSVLLVGDAKQSIYRWRGGKAEQFISLYSGDENPFLIEGRVVDLEENYRSLPSIIQFNNLFFRFISEKFKSETYRELYKNAAQNFPEIKKGKELPEGYVNIHFVDLQEDEEAENQTDSSENTTDFTEKELIYCQAILKAVEHANASGVKDQYITVLVRKNSEGAAVASFLSAKGRNIISPDSLLLKNVDSIQFLISLLKLIYNSDSQELKSKMLFNFVGVKKITEVHEFMTQYIEAPLDVFFADYGFSLTQFNTHSLYEGVTFAVNCFDLAKESDAYLTHFLDLIFDFKTARKGGLADFLAFWEEEKDKISISSPEGLDAISIMTVHKSKGLSAPVIIYAFADNKLIDKHKDDTIWYPVAETEFSGFQSLLVQVSKNWIHYEPHSEQLMLQHNEQQLLDQINVLYVALTRPESFLYVITSQPKTKSGKESKSETYGTLFKHFIQQHSTWDEAVQTYEFGTPVFPAKKQKTTPETDTLIHFQKDGMQPNYKIATGASLLWDTSRQHAIEKGNLIHEILSKVTYHFDLEKVMNNFLTEGILTNVQYEVIYPQLFDLIHHPEISDFFTEKYEYFIEKEFINQNGKFFRPDRIVYNRQTQEAIIIDYKTGKPNPKYEQQMQDYATDLATMGWKITAKYLIFLEDGTIVKSEK